MYPNVIFEEIEFDHNNDNDDDPLMMPSQLPSPIALMKPPGPKLIRQRPGLVPAALRPSIISPFVSNISASSSVTPRPPVPGLVSKFSNGPPTRPTLIRKSQ